MAHLENQENLTISQVAQRASIRPSTIRYYESIDLLPIPRRISGQRRYSPSILPQLAFINVARKLGFSLAEIHLLLHNETGSLSIQWQTLAQQKIAEVDLLLQQASTMKQSLLQGLQCNCSTLLDCIQCIVSNCSTC
jgi:MerR family transcriptional regulator, redox-sensitive transcriptional activator SoxR